MAGDVLALEPLRLAAALAEAAAEAPSEAPVAAPSPREREASPGEYAAQASHGATLRKRMLRLRARQWRARALAERDRRSRRAADFVPWEARFTRHALRGSPQRAAAESAPAVGAAPLPFDPFAERGRRLDRLRRLRADQECRAKRALRAKQHERAQRVQRVPETEAVAVEDSATQTLRTSRACGELERLLAHGPAAARHCASSDASGEAARVGVLARAAREAAACEAAAQDAARALQVELGELVCELARQKRLRAQKAAAAGGTARPKRERTARPVFLSGVGTGRSWNQHAAASARAATRMADAPFASRAAGAAHVWDGSDFKIGLIEDLVRKRRLQIVFAALRGPARAASLRSEAAWARARELANADLCRAWGALRRWHTARAWLRERCRAQAAARKRRLAASVLGQWRRGARHRVGMLGRHLVAAEHVRRKRLWLAFAAWRATTCVARYHALCLLRASQWRRRSQALRALRGWHALWLRHQAIRLRLTAPALSRRATSLPVAQTRVGLPAALARRRAAVRADMDAWLDRALLDAAQAAVASARCGLVRAPGAQALASQIDMAPSRVSDLLRGQAEDIFVAAGRAWNAWARQATATNKVQTAPAGPRGPRRLAPFGLGALAAKPLRAHVRALESFIRGDRLKYVDVTDRVSWTPPSSPTPRAAPPPEAAAPHCLLEAPGWSRGWAERLAVARWRRNRAGIVLRAWAAAARATRDDRLAAFAARKFALRRCLRKLQLARASGGARRELCDALFRARAQRRHFEAWRKHAAAWRRVAARGTFAPWGRWRHFAAARARLRRRVVQLRTAQLVRRAWRSWRTWLARRQLWRRVLEQRDAAWEAREAREALDPLERQFRLLETAMSSWKALVVAVRCERRGAENAAAAELYAKAALFRRVFGAWADAARAPKGGSSEQPQAWGPPVWTDASDAYELL